MTWKYKTIYYLEGIAHYTYLNLWKMWHAIIKGYKLKSEIVIWCYENMLTLWHQSSRWAPGDLELHGKYNESESLLSSKLSHNYRLNLKH